jgi:hypothetical protein
MVFFLIALEVVNVLTLVSLWRRPTSLTRKLLWSLVVLLPVVGPIFYGGLFEVPPRMPESEQL